MTKEILAQQYNEATKRSKPPPHQVLVPRLSPDEMESLANDARNPRTMLTKGQGQWLATVVHLGSYAFVADKRLECASAHGRDIDVCFSRLITIIEPTNDSMGIVAHAYSELIDPSHGPSPSSQNHPQCEAYVRCVAEARVGETIPIPTDERDTFALEELYQSDALRPDLLDTEKVRGMISQFDKAVVMLEERTSLTLEEQWKLANTREHASYLRRHLLRLESLEASTAHDNLVQKD